MLAAALLAGPGGRDARAQGPRGAPQLSAWPGPALFEAGNPANLPVSACSTRHAVCVHAKSAAAPVLETLASAERAWDVATGPLQMPPPERDVETGVWDIVLGEPAGGALGATSVAHRGFSASFDRASAVTTLDARLRPGCTLDYVTARELFRAIGYRAAPATDEGTARGEAAALAHLAVPCAGGTPDGVEVFQQNPDRAIADAWRWPPAQAPAALSAASSPSSPAAWASAGRRFGHGSGLFFWWLDDSFAQSPGSTVLALYALAATRTPDGASRWVDEPDAFDVLRTSMKGALSEGSTIDDLFVDFAVARAFAGTAADDAHFPESRGLGDAARVRVDWDIAWPATPRGLASPAPLAPTGAAYVRVDHAGAPPGSRLRIEARWEELARMRWVAVKLDAQGREQARIPINVAEKATTGALTLAELDHTASILLVGVNAGNWSTPFDPDDEVWEPHGWVLDLAAR